MQIITVGSKAFFNNMPDYIEHDNDILFILDKWPDCIDDIYLSFGKKKNDLFFIKELDKESYITNILSITNPMELTHVCHFMVPEFVKYIGLTIDDLKRLEPIVRLLKGTRHEWYCTVYDAYIENSDFYLTDEQRIEAYQVYKQARYNRFNNTFKDS